MSNSNLNPTAPEESVAPSEPSFGDILSEFEHQHPKKPEDGVETVDGVVIKVADDAIYVDVGRKHEGILSLDSVKDPAGNIRVKAGDKVKVSVGGRDENGYHVLSVFKVVVPSDWSALERAFAEKSVISGIVEEMIKGGFRVDVGVRAFLPASRSGARDEAEMEKLLGQTIECRITKLDTQGEDVVLDRRSILEERAAQARQAAFDALREGDVVTGTVRGLMDFGAFVDLGGIDGLLHVAEMSWTRGVKPSDVVTPGEQVQVKILKINRETRKVSLGMKQLLPDPWSAVAASINPGDRVKGKVSRVADFGAFVELQQGIEGLIHVSEMSWSKKQKRPADIVKPGEMVEVVVLTVNAAEKRIGLGLKQALGDPWEDAKKKYVRGAVVEGPVTSLANFGVFVDLGDGIEGMIHIGDITSEKRLQHPKEALAAGQIVKAVVIELDQERRRVKLGMKQLEPTSADEYIAERNAGDVVTGRVIEAGASHAKIDLGEGVKATCRLKQGSKSSSGGSAESPKADLGSLSAMLAAKWKSGPATQTSSGDSLKTGEVRQFRITSLDASKKLIELELAE